MCGTIIFYLKVGCKEGLKLIAKSGVCAYYCFHFQLLFGQYGG